VLLSGLLYTLGRTLTYLALGVLIVAGLLAIPSLSAFLQKYMHLLLGPLLIIAGMFLLELISFKRSGGGVSEGLQSRVDKSGVWGALVLGTVFALTFCPTSAALFFGSLIPLAVEQRSSVMLPAVYGIGTALPVIAFALLIALGMQYVARAFNILRHVEVWARRVTGVVFVAVGIFYCARYIYGAF
jgi:cytochrome c biogenesis protein CcdA